MQCKPVLYWNVSAVYVRLALECKCSLCPSCIGMLVQSKPACIVMLVQCNPFLYWNVSAVYAILVLEC